MVLILEKRRRLGRPDRTRVEWATRDAVDEQKGKKDDAEIGRNEGRQPSKQKAENLPAASRIQLSARVGEDYLLIETLVQRVM